MIPGLDLLSPAARALVDPAVVAVDLLGDPEAAQPVGLALGFDLSDVPTGLPAAHRTATPQPALREPDYDPPAPSLPPQTPAPVAREEAPHRQGPEPIRVAVEQQLVFHEPTPTPLAERDLIPDEHRIEWYLERILDAVLNMSGGIDRVVGVIDTVRAIRLDLGTIDKRIARLESDEAAAREAALDAAANQSRAQRLLASPHAGRVLAVLTWVGGMISMGILDYLGLESEPVFRFVALIWGL